MGPVLGPADWSWDRSQDQSGSRSGIESWCDRWYWVPIQTAALPPQTTPDTFPDWHPGHWTGSQVVTPCDQTGPCGYSRPCGSRGSLDPFCKRVQYVKSNRARLGPACCRRPVQGNFGKASFRATPGEATAPGQLEVT